MSNPMASINRLFKPASKQTTRCFAAKTKVVRPKEPVRITVTGAAGSIGYSLLPRIASGQMLGPEQPVILQLLELPSSMKQLEGVVMELKDCAFPLLRGIVMTDSVQKAFEGADYGLLIGGKPRGPGMERGDLIKDNAKIFAEQGKALNSYANRNVRVLVVGNPANTNALITSHYAPKIPTKHITAMTRLDQNRAISQIAEKVGCKTSDVDRFALWGNHSATQHPDISHCYINGRQAKEVIKDENWVKDVFIPTVQQRGAAIIAARGQGSAGSAASAVIDHMRDWMLGTNGKWLNMAVCSDGSYGIDKGIWYSFPAVTRMGDFMIVPNLPCDDFTRERMEITKKELLQEREIIAPLLK